MRPIIFIPRFAEIWGSTSLSDTARALYRALVRPEGRAFFSQYGEPSKLCQNKSATTSSARFISTSDADKPPQKCNSRYRGLLAVKVHWTFTNRSRGLETFVFFPRQILRTPRFCLRTKSLRSLCKISSSKSQKTPAGYAPDPTVVMAANCYLDVLGRMLTY